MTELRLARTLAGITQAEAARVANIDRSTLSRYEATGQAPIEVLRTLAHLYNAPQLVLGHASSAFGDTPTEALSWLKEELEEAMEAAKRLDVDLRHGRQIDADLVGQVYDLYTAMGALFVALRGSVDLDAVRTEHERKLRKYPVRAVA